MAANPATDVQHCIQQCQQTAQQLRALANQENNPEVKMLLTEGAHHLDLCVVECQFSMQQLQTPAMA